MSNLSASLFFPNSLENYFVPVWLFALVKGKEAGGGVCLFFFLQLQKIKALGIKAAKNKAESNFLGLLTFPGTFFVPKS